MKASVQYNDITGTVAADVSDWHDNLLQEFLKRSYSNYNADAFHCIGCTAYIGEGNKVSVNFICRHEETSGIVKFTTNDYWSLEDFFNLFKRFEIVIGNHIQDIEDPGDSSCIILKSVQEEAE